MSAPTTRPPEPTAPPEHVNGSGAAAPNTGTAAKSGVPKRIAPYQLTGAESVVRSLEELDVELIFGIPGGAVLPVYDPLFDSQKLRHVLVRHEQAAGHAGMRELLDEARGDYLWFIDPDDLVEPGVIPPELIDLPGIFVKRIICGAPYDKKIEQRTIRKA